MGLLNKITNSPIPVDDLRAIDAVKGWLSMDEAALLYKLASAVESGCIVEVGSYHGRSTVALGLGTMAGNNSPVFAVEPHEEFAGALGGNFGPEDRAEFFKSMLQSSCYKVVRLLNISSEIITSGWEQPVSLLWIDGDHRYEGVKRDFESWERHLENDATIVFDDATNPELGPYRLVSELINAGKYLPVVSAGKVVVLERA